MIFALLVITMLLTFPLGALALDVPTSPYSDVTEDAWYYDIVCDFTEYGVVGGYSDGTFGPNQNITRAEFVVMLNRFLNPSISREITVRDVSFSDVKEGQWFYNDIMTLAGMGLVNGYADGTFRPNNDITREEIAYILYKFFGPMVIKAEDISGIPEDAYRYFPDVLADRWSANAIYLLYHYGIVSGYPDGTFHPAANATRAEALSFLYHFGG